MKILFIGDIVGKVGRRMIHDYLQSFVDKYNIDFVIANGENVSHGKGLLENHYHELINDGVDAITLGNHYKSKNEIIHYIDNVNRLIRPLNLTNNFNGEGSVMFDVDGISVRVTNILGSAFMTESVTTPYYSLLECLENVERANIHIVDFHAEATGEKRSLGLEFDGKVSAVIGTHTHVQTRDAQILPNGTAFISDVGMTGYYDGVLGFDAKTVIKKTLYGDNCKFDIPNEGRGVFSAVVMNFDNYSGKCLEIFPIYFVEEKKHEN